MNILENDLSMKDFYICPTCKQETCEFWDDYFECCRAECGERFEVCSVCDGWEGGENNCYYCRP